MLGRTKAGRAGDPRRDRWLERVQMNAVAPYGRMQDPYGRAFSLRVGFAIAFALIWIVSSIEALAESPGDGAGGAVDASPPEIPDAVVRGERVFFQTGGCSCHTNYPGEGDEAPLLAGGRAMETPFGVFYSTNITSDSETGIGNWTPADFVRAMQDGVSPEGEHYFPTFPYPSFTGLSDQDLLDLEAYLRSLPAVQRENRPPDAPFPFSWRATVAGWKLLNFEPGRLEPVAGESEAWNLGRYLVNAAAHCGECHTPRTLTGGLDRSLWMAGSKDGPEGELAPNITPDEATGIGRWSTRDLVWYLQMGMKPDGDDTQGLMSEVIEHGYANLPASDLEAIAIYLKSLSPIENRVKGGSGED